MSDPNEYGKFSVRVADHDLGALRDDAVAQMHEVARGVVGLTKRELFASLAMQGQLAGTYDLRPRAVARDSVRYADALLAELASAGREVVGDE